MEKLRSNQKSISQLSMTSRNNSIGLAHKRFNSTTFDYDFDKQIDDKVLSNLQNTKIVVSKKFKKLPSIGKCVLMKPTLENRI